MGQSPKNFFRVACIPALLLAMCANRANGAVKQFAQSCSVEAATTSARVFSDNENNRWKEYATPKQVPENAEWSEIAYVWAKEGSPVLIDIEGLGEDFGDSTYYCFDTSGKLSSLEHEFRTAWGWGFTEQREFDRDGKESAKSHFFSMKDRKEVPRPEGANDVREAMTLKLYKRLSEVPFLPLLTRTTKPE